MNHPPPPASGDAVRRAALPFFVRPEDLAFHLPGVTAAAARSLLRGGFAGEPLLIHGEPVATRGAVVDALESWAASGRDLAELLS